MFFCSTCMLTGNVCVSWSRPCFPLHNFPVFVAFAATYHGWHTPITEKLLLWLEVTTSGRSSTLASLFLKHTALSRKNRIRITSHLLLRCKAWTHLHLSPSWMGGQATGWANANANFQSQERRVRVSEAISGVENDSLVSFVTTKLCSSGVFLRTAFKQVLPPLATLATRSPNCVLIRVTECELAGRITLTMELSLRGRNSLLMRPQNSNPGQPNGVIPATSWQGPLPLSAGVILRLLSPEIKVNLSPSLNDWTPP